MLNSETFQNLKKQNRCLSCGSYIYNTIQKICAECEMGKDIDEYLRYREQEQFTLPELVEFQSRGIHPRFLNENY